MERKTQIKAEDSQHDLLVTREFDLPVELLFKAHIEPELFREWMSHEYGRVELVKYDVRRHGSWHFQTVDAQNNVLFEANGTFHDVVPNKKIIRTFQMDNSPFDVQLEFLEFESLSADTSKLSMHMVFRSVALRNEMVKLPFAQGLNLAHNRLQQIIGKLK